MANAERRRAGRGAWARFASAGICSIAVGPAAAAGPATSAQAISAPAAATQATAAQAPATQATAAQATAIQATASQATAAQAPASHCLPSGDGYFRAHLAGAVQARIDWHDKGTRCEGESRDAPPGVRLSFQRTAHRDSNLLFVFGLTGVREGRPAKEVGANLTLILQGTARIYGTLGDSRCTVDSLSQKPLSPPSKAYRVEARGFCTQPAHAVRGDGEVLVSTFEFAGLVNYDTPEQNLNEVIPATMTPAR